MDLLISLTLFSVLLWAATCAFVFQKDARNPLNRSFLILGLCTCTWGTGIILRYTSLDESAGRAFFNVAMLGAIMTISFFFRFIVCFLDSAVDEPLGRRASMALQGSMHAVGLGLFLALTITGMGATGFRMSDGRMTVETGPMFTVVVIWGIIVGVFSVALILFFKSRMKRQRHLRQANLILTAMFVPLASIGILELAFRSTSRMQFIGEPFFATVAFGLIVAWGTIKFGLMSVTPETAATQIVESLPESLLLIDPSGDVISANRTFYDLSGRTRAEVEGKPVWQNFKSSGDGEPNSSRINLSSTRRADFRLDLASSSGLIPVNVATKPILDSYGDRVGSLMLLTDMRPAQKIEAELVNAEKLAGLGQLVAGVAHEINNPMTTVMGLSELGKKKFENESSGAFFAQIFDQSVRIRDIVAHLLLFARKSPDRVEETDLASILDEASEIVRMGVKSADTRVEKRYARGAVIIQCDQGKVRQVFVNVIRNAFDAISLAGGKGTVVISAAITDGVARVEIADDGCGIDPEVMPRIFNPFFTTKEIGKGTGLGLSISHGIVDAHGGRITAESEKGRGARIVIELPVESAFKPDRQQVASELIGP